MQPAVQSPGKVGPRRVFAKLPEKDPAAGQIDNQPDGMCLDAAGNLYVAHYGMKQVQVLDPTGKLVRSYDGGNLTTSNVDLTASRADWDTLSSQASSILKVRQFTKKAGRKLVKKVAFADVINLYLQSRLATPFTTSVWACHLNC